MKKSFVSTLSLSCLLVLGMDLACNKNDTPVPPLLKPDFTVTSSETPTATFTPMNTFTQTDTPTVTDTPTHTATPTVTDTPTGTFTPTFTPTSTPTCTGYTGVLTAGGFANETGEDNTALFATEVTVSSSATAWAIEGTFESYIDQDIQFGLYDDSGNLLVSSAQGTLPGTGNGFMFGMPIPSTSVSSGTSYWIACMVRNTSPSNYGAAVEWPANNGGGYVKSATWGAMPSTISPSESGSFSMELRSCP